MPRIAPLRLIQPAELKLLADPVREYLVNATVERARTVAELAAGLKCPPTRLYYHVQRLERAGLLFVERTRLVSGIVERHYRAAARVLRLDRTEFGRARGARDPRVAAILAHVFERASEEIRAGVAAGRIDLGKLPPDPAALLCYGTVLRLGPKQARALSARVRAFYAAIEAQAQGPAAADAEGYAFTIAFHRARFAAPATRPPRRGRDDAARPRTRRRSLA